MRLNDTVPLMTSASEVVTISVSSVDDMPIAQSDAIAFDEDSVPDGVEVALNLSDAEVNRVLEGFISRLPTKGMLFAINASGHRLRIDQEHNIFAIDRTVTRRSPHHTHTMPLTARTLMRKCISRCRRCASTSQRSTGCPAFGACHPTRGTTQ